MYNLQVHVRIASPPVLYPCHMGINIPTREELIANKLDRIKLADHAGKQHSFLFNKCNFFVPNELYNTFLQNDFWGGHFFACQNSENCS